MGADRRAPLHASVIRRLARKAGYADLFKVWGSVVVRPGFFDDTAHDIPPVIWTVDDVWVSGMRALRGIPIWIPRNLYAPPKAEAAFAEANARCVSELQRTFGIWQ